MTFPVIPPIDTRDAISSATEDGYWLMRIDGFPFQEYMSGVKKAAEQAQWYTGEALDAKDKRGNPLYPARINPLPATVEVHTWTLFGQVADSSPALVVPKFAKPKSDDESTDDLAQQAEELLLKFWEENAGRAYQYENGLLSQIFGGSYIKLRYAPSDYKKELREIPVALDRVMPFEVVAKLDPSNPWRCREAWVVRKLTIDEAETYLGEEAAKAIKDKYTNFYVEHWTEETFTIWVNNEPIKYKGEMLLQKPNPFGIVPIFYAPHIRAGELLGRNAFDHLINLIKEINLIHGHVGDAIAVQAHDLVVAINADNPEFKKIRAGLEILMLDNQRKFDTTRGDADMKSISRQLVTSTMLEQVKELYKQYRRDARHPAVLDGEDEGSQRSAATLIVRMLSLVSHSDMERVFFAEALNQANKAVLRLCANLEAPLRNYAVTKEHLKLRMFQRFGAAIPKDRLQFIQELQIRRQENLGTLEHLLSLLDDVEDPEGMAKEIEFMLMNNMLAQAVIMRNSEASSTDNGEATDDGTDNTSGEDERDEVED